MDLTRDYYCNSHSVKSRNDLGNSIQSRDSFRRIDPNMTTNCNGCDAVVLYYKMRKYNPLKSIKDEFKSTPFVTDGGLLKKMMKYKEMKMMPFVNLGILTPKVKKGRTQIYASFSEEKENKYLIRSSTKASRNSYSFIRDRDNSNKNKSKQSIMKDSLLMNNKISIKGVSSKMKEYDLKIKQIPKYIND